MISPLGKALRVVVVLLLAGITQTLLPQVWVPLGQIDLLMIAVGLLALRTPFRTAIGIGAVGGLIHDGLAGGIVGLHGFAKTAIAAGLTLLADFFAVRGQLAEAMIVAVATFGEAMIVRALLTFFEWPGAESVTSALSRAGLTGLVCGIGTVGIPLAISTWQRRRQRRGLRWN